MLHSSAVPGAAGSLRPHLAQPPTEAQGANAPDDIDPDAIGRRALEAGARTAQHAHPTGWLGRLLRLDPLLGVLRRAPQVLWWWLSHDPIVSLAAQPSAEARIAALKILAGEHADEFLLKVLSSDKLFAAERLALLRRYATPEKVRALCDEWLRLPETAHLRRAAIIRLIGALATDRALNARYAESWRWRVAAVESIGRLWQATDDPSEREALLEALKGIGYRDRSPEVLLAVVRAIRSILEPVYRWRQGARGDVQLEHARLGLLSGLVGPSAVHSYDFQGTSRARPARLSLSTCEERQLGLILAHHYQGTRPDVKGEVGITYAVLERYGSAMRLPMPDRAFAPCDRPTSGQH